MTEGVNPLTHFPVIPLYDIMRDAGSRRAPWPGLLFVISMTMSKPH